MKTSLVLKGKLTYLTSAVMVGLGIAMLGADNSPTYDDPHANLVGAYRNVVGWVLLTQGVGLAALRRAINSARDAVVDAVLKTSLK